MKAALLLLLLTQSPPQKEAEPDTKPMGSIMVVFENEEAFKAKAVICVRQKPNELFCFVPKMQKPAQEL